MPGLESIELMHIIKEIIPTLRKYTFSEYGILILSLCYFMNQFWFLEIFKNLLYIIILFGLSLLIIGAPLERYSSKKEMINKNTMIELSYDKLIVLSTGGGDEATNTTFHGLKSIKMPDKPIPIPLNIIIENNQHNVKLYRKLKNYFNFYIELSYHQDLIQIVSSSSVDLESRGLMKKRINITRNCDNASFSNLIFIMALKFNTTSDLDINLFIEECEGKNDIINKIRKKYYETIFNTNKTISIIS
jgi:hypothetical protein